MRAASKSRPRTKPPEERREELMQAAQRLFLKHGLASTTIEQITSGAKVAKGTFYLYFSSKDDILAALRERFGQQLLQNIKSAVAAQPAGAWREKLAAWAAAGIDSYLDSIRLHDILFYGSPRPTREGLVKNVIIDHLVELLQAGSAAGAWSVEDPAFTAIFLFSGLHSAVEHSQLGAHAQPADRVQLAQKLQQHFLRTVAASSA